MDHFDARVDHLRPLGEFAFEILRRTYQCEFKITLSSLVIKELLYNDYGKQIKDLIEYLKEKDKVIMVEVTDEDIKKARIISQERKTPFNDTLHAVIANRVNAAYLVTRNLKDFYELQDLVKITFPEEL